MAHKMGRTVGVRARRIAARLARYAAPPVYTLEAILPLREYQESTSTRQTARSAQGGRPSISYFTIFHHAPDAGGIGYVQDFVISIVSRCQDGMRHGRGYPDIEHCQHIPRQDVFKFVG